MVEENDLRSIVKNVFEEKEVAYVIGYEKIDFGGRVRPRIFHSIKELDDLTWSPFCTINLVNLLKFVKSGEMVGIIVKGCDSRALVQLIQERGIDRSSLVIIGVVCDGVVDPVRAKELCKPGSTIKALGREGTDAVFEIDGKEKRIPSADIYSERCEHCQYPNPLIYDILVGETIEPWSNADDYESVTKELGSPLEKRWAFWQKEFSKCIRCYACRNACPLCYCPECMAENLDSQWLKRSIETSECGGWNIMRAMHLAGRCIGCGSCENACPMDIPLMMLNKCLEKSVFERFGHIAGVDPNGKPGLASFDPNDPQEFIS